MTLKMNKIIPVWLALFAFVCAEPPQQTAGLDGRAQLYLRTLAKMREVAPPVTRIPGDISQITWDMSPGNAACRGTLKPFWRTQITPDRWLAANSGWLLPSTDPVFDLLEKETGRAFKNKSRNLILSDTVSTVRLLGGWNPQWKNGEVLPDTSADSYDLAWRDENGNIQYRWNLLHGRLDPIVQNGLTPFIVLDNIPFCFAPKNNGAESYGQVLAPVNFKEWGAFIEALCHELADRYGFDKANSWRFRIGTEIDNVHHWENAAPDSLEKYLKTYDFAADAVKRVLPEAKVGPCNFNSMFAGQLNRTVPPLAVFQHFAMGTNYATGKVGSPVDFVAISSYGMYWMGGKFDHPDAARYGYYPDTLGIHVDFLKRLRACSPRFAGIPLEIQEHGTLFNKEDTISYEPGAFGAAWTAAQYAVGLEQGVSQIFHWQDFERIGNKVILFGSTWVRVMLEKMGGGEVWIPGIANASENSFIKAFAVRNGNKLYLVVSCYNADRVSGDEKVEMRLPAMKNMKIRQYQLSAETAPYDVMEHDLKASGLLKGEMNTLSTMAAPAGAAQVRANAGKYELLQTKSFNPEPFAGQVVLQQNGIGLILSVPAPSVTVLEITDAAASQEGTAPE